MSKTAAKLAATVLKKAKAAKRKAEKGKSAKVSDPVKHSPSANGTAIEPTVVPDEIKAAAWAAEASTWNKEEIALDKIKFGSRYRKDYSNIETLARSIRTLGLMTPIVVTAEDNQLIAGGRRCKAVEYNAEHHGGPKVITAIRADLSSEKGQRLAALTLMMERDENECRAGFKTQEMMELMKDLENLLPRRTEKGGTPRRQAIARAAGISHETKRQMEVVDRLGVKDERFSEVRNRMMNDQISPKQAFEEIEKIKKNERDQVGNMLPDTKEALVAWETVGDVDAALGCLQTAKKLVNQIANLPGGERLVLSGHLTARQSAGADGSEGQTKFTHAGLEELVGLMREAMPHCQCPICAEKAGAIGKYWKSCTLCRGCGHIGKSQYEELVKADDKSLKTLAKIAKESEKLVKVE